MIVLDRIDINAAPSERLKLHALRVALKKKGAALVTRRLLQNFCKITPRNNYRMPWFSLALGTKKVLRMS
jgi:hypothetical protein